MSNDEPILDHKCPQCNATLVGRHCLAAFCGWSRRSPEDKAKQERPHMKIEPGDGSGLLELSAKYKISFPESRLGYDKLLWRNGKLKEGMLPTFDLPVRLLATNEVVAWFLLTDETTFWGHLSNFKADVAEPTSGPRAKRAPSKKRLKELDILASI